MDERQPLLQKLQREVEDVQVIVEHNVKRAINERGELIKELDQRADELQKAGRQLKKTTGALRENQPQSCSRKTIAAWCIFFLIIAIIIIAIIITGALKHWF